MVQAIPRYRQDLLRGLWGLWIAEVIEIKDVLLALYEAMEATSFVDDLLDICLKEQSLTDKNQLFQGESSFRIHIFCFTSLEGELLAEKIPWVLSDLDPVSIIQDLMFYFVHLGLPAFVEEEDEGASIDDKRCCLFAPGSKSERTQALAILRLISKQGANYYHQAK